MSAPIRVKGSHLEEERGIKDAMGTTLKEKEKKARKEKLGPITEEEPDHNKERGPEDQTPLDSNDGPIKQFVANAEARKQTYEFIDDEEGQNNLSSPSRMKSLLAFNKSNQMKIQMLKLNAQPEWNNMQIVLNLLLLQNPLIELRREVWAYAASVSKETSCKEA
ncbi:unnamed protein product [Citrullus colocynthis]|uniref:Uncharacterized protein n=1 Tax=Citrullus colocynthis TaxID=252529 RepID=A0ABP0YU83_9ROSI